MSTKTKEDAIRELKAVIACDPELAAMPIATDGKQAFSLNQILEEIEKDTEQGKKFAAHYCGE